MTTSDRTEELVRAMLERRAEQPMPDWLLARTMHAVIVAPQTRPGPWARRLPSSPALRVALAAALVVVLTALAGGALAAAGLLDLPGITEPEPSRPAVVLGPSPTAASGPGPSDEVEPSPDAPMPQVTPKPMPAALAVDSLAVVTAAGDGLRVRSAPGTGADSKKLTPLLPQGTRMFVVDGPVAADGMDWYQVKASDEEGMFGWVSSGKDGEQWIKKTAPKCLETLDETAPWKVPAMDFLVCYGDAPVTVRAVAWQEPGLDNGEGYWICPWTGQEAYCALDPEWLSMDMYFTYTHDGREAEEGSAVVAPGVDAGPGMGLSRQGVTLTLAMDAPEAAGCRVVDGRGRDVLPPEEAVLTCRLTFVVREMEWEPAEPMPALESDALAQVVDDDLELWSDPREATRVVEGRIAADTVVYVDGRWPETGPVEWYAVLSGDPQDQHYGWVKAPTDDGQLVQIEPDCAPMTEWAAFLELDRLERLVCTGAERVTLDMYLWVMQPANPTWSDGCGAWSYLPSTGVDYTCQATPEWLSSFSGIAMRRPGDMELFATYDPSMLDRSAFPTSETWVQVTGAWKSPASSQCRVQDATTGVDLLRPPQAAIYCRGSFVITGIGPATTSP